jgi:hypothetical protein
VEPVLSLTRVAAALGAAVLEHARNN